MSASVADTRKISLLIGKSSEIVALRLVETNTGANWLRMMLTLTLVVLLLDDTAPSSAVINICKKYRIF